MANRIPPIPDFNIIPHRSPETSEKVWQAVNKGWTPGKTGKGMLVGQQLYHWNTVDDDGFPHHHQVADVLHHAGVPTLDGKGDLHPDIGLVFYIDPDGTFDSHQEHAQDVVRNDPRLSPDSEAYKFTSWKSADGEGGGEGGGVAEGPTPATVVYGYPFLGGWGYAQRRFQDNHRKKKRRKKRKKKSDSWFPSDYEPTAADMPATLNRDEILEFVRAGWQEGTPGKALIDESGRRYAWSPNKWGQPHHHDVEDAIPGCVAADEIIIDPDGTEHSWRQMQELEDLNEDAEDQGFGGGQWVFGSSLDGNRLDWEEGYEGKGILGGNGVLYTWAGDEYETHQEYLNEHPEIDHENAHYLYISPHGKVSTIWGTLNYEIEQLIREADPRLYVDLDTGNGAPWSFGA